MSPHLSVVGAAIAALITLSVGCADLSDPDADANDRGTDQATDTALEDRAQHDDQPPAGTQDPAEREEEALDLSPDLMESLERQSLDGRYRWGSIEHLTWHVDCMAEFGFKVEVVGEGHMRGHGVAREQQDAYGEASEECRIRAAEVGIIRYPPDPPTEEDIRLRHQAWLIAHECLIEHGHPTSPPPSEDSFVESGGFNWHPFRQLAGPGLLEAAEEDCTQNIRELYRLLDERRQGG
jgi:hypothetical protein